MANMVLKKGFTLLEMVIVIGLVSGITLVASAFLTRSIASYRMKSQSVRLEEQAAQVMRDFERITRATTEILTASDSELKFYRYFDLTSSYPTQVRYFVNGSQFKVGITAPSGVAPNVTYPADNEAIDLIVDNVTNPGNLFKYYDGTNALLAQPVSIPAIKMIGLTISLDRNSNLPPGPITDITKVSLRNMKDNL